MNDRDDLSERFEEHRAHFCAPWRTGCSGRLSRALTFKIVNGKITEIEVIGDPARLAALEVSSVD